MKTAKQFADFAASVTEDEDYAGQYITLTRDIELDGEWTPIEGFAGSFDGAGHTISGLTMGTKDAPLADSEKNYMVYYGLFAGLGDLAVVRNVKRQVSAFI